MAAAVGQTWRIVRVHRTAALRAVHRDQAEIARLLRALATRESDEGRRALLRRLARVAEQRSFRAAAYFGGPSATQKPGRAQRLRRWLLVRSGRRPVLWWILFLEARDARLQRRVITALIGGRSSK